MRKETIAYAITHAPPGVKGGPYEGCGAIGGATAHLGCALRWPDAGGRMWAREALASVRRSVPHARVIRIVRARPSEAMPVVRAAMRETDAEEAFSAAPHCGRRGEAAALDAAARARVEAVGKFRKAGSK